MKPWLSDPDLDLYVGDVRDVLPTLAAESVDCVATSPPFFGLRDYGTGEWEGGDPDCDHAKVRDAEAAVATSTLGGGKKSTGHLQEVYGVECPRCGARRVDRQIGLEATPEEWVSELVAVFRECRRVLRPAGTLWVECGDSYAANTRGGYAKNFGPIKHPFKPKDLLGQPWMLAFALRADGWYLRQCIVWHKPNAMPESVRDRCTTAHSYVFLFSKQPRYWFDADAIAEPAEWARWGDQTVPKYEGTETSSGWMQPKTKAELQAFRGPSWEERKAAGAMGGNRARDAVGAGVVHGEGLSHDLTSAHSMKNARSVWQIPTSGYPGAHFATWPEKLVERIVLAGCPEWVCSVCGKARERLTERNFTNPGNRSTNGQKPRTDERRGFDVRLEVESETVGWSDCGHNAYVPGTILDPFFGSGTTGLVARRHGRRSVGVELNEEYAAMAAKRLQQLSLLAV